MKILQRDIITQIRHRKPWSMDGPRFQLGDRVRVCRILDPNTSHIMVGKIGLVTDIDMLAGGQYNYYIDGTTTDPHGYTKFHTYMHEQELEPA